MYIYAELNTDNIVVGFSQLSGEINAENWVRVDGVNVELGSMYNRTTGEFTPPELQPISEPKASVEEITEETLLETKYQTFLLEMLV